MDTKRAFLAIVLSLLILFGYQYFFIPAQQIQEPSPVSGDITLNNQSSTEQAPAVNPVKSITASSQLISAPVIPDREGRDIIVETNLYSAIISETGGGIKSFRLKKFNESLDPELGPKELVKTVSPHQLPLFFSWGTEPEKFTVPFLRADKEKISVSATNNTLTLQGNLSSGLELTRTYVFSADDYMIGLTVDVVNTSSEHQLQGAPFLSMTNKPFSEISAKDRFLFQGPALSTNGVIEEFKPDDLKKEIQVRGPGFDWAAYEDTYFMTGLMPDPTGQDSVHFSIVGEDTVSTILSGNVVVLPPQTQKRYTYTAYFGPKQLSILKKSGHNLEKIINFGWFDILAKPMLYLLNFLYGFMHNYGLAIIFVTIIIKGAFWPIAHKGMKSMKVLQKLQPKMAKLREKYANDKERLNQEMIQLYKTYKVNPMGGCLPMLLQIPVFFALYKVLLQTIELRHAPFMMWITDLSAPDRLFIGIDIPYLGGIPVLTLLMGATMFLQQKMTPTAADPTQAKIMMFLPVVFTFMFLNFASGLVLYWFVNNLLSIAQQYVINKAD